MNIILKDLVQDPQLKISTNKVLGIRLYPQRSKCPFINPLLDIAGSMKFLVLSLSQKKIDTVLTNLLIITQNVTLHIIIYFRLLVMTTVCFCTLSKVVAKKSRNVD